MLCAGSLALAPARLPRARLRPVSVTTIPPGRSRIITRQFQANTLLGRDRDCLTIDELAEYLDFRVTKLELRLHRSPCCALEPAERPHEQQYRDGNTQQPQKSCSTHMCASCVPRQRHWIGQVPTRPAAQRRSRALPPLCRPAASAPRVGMSFGCPSCPALVLRAL
jgi:hypothetical protein